VTKHSPKQATLFDLPEAAVAAAELEPEHAELAAQLPPALRFGTMSWNYAGWRGTVYAPNANPKRLSNEGLPAYTRHPLLTTVELDRTYYEPLPTPVLTQLADQVPAGFQFVIKAHEACVLRRFPVHARYGVNRGQPNPLYLDAAHASDAVIEPAREAFGDKLGVILFQFPPQDAGAADTFAAELGVFLQSLPQGIVYAVELRNRELLVPAYATALAASGAVHCHNVWGDMPSALVQARLMPPIARRPLVIRWLMRRGDDYRSAGERYLPFNRLVDEDLKNRDELARLVARASEHDVPAFVLVDNKAEGCAPESIVRLARAIVQAR
jgi:uncharacterized protein YecE (DUF72 family)